MKLSNGLMLATVVGAEATGCAVDGVGLNPGITAEECFNNITNGKVSLANQEEVVTNPKSNDAYADSDGEFHDTLKLQRKEYLDSLVVLAAIGNLDGSSSTSELGTATTGTFVEEFGNGSVKGETTNLRTTVDFGAIPSLAETQIDMLVTSPDCEELYSDVFHYEIEDRSGSDDDKPFYIVEEM